jgi:hypothetical protein
LSLGPFCGNPLHASRIFHVTLNSASSRDEVLAAYLDAACYAEVNDAALCRQFITACRCLLLILPKRAVHGQGQAEQIETSPELLQQQIVDARRWLSSNDAATPQTTFSDFSNFRQ